MDDSRRKKGSGGPARRLSGSTRRSKLPLLSLILSWGLQPGGVLAGDVSSELECNLYQVFNGFRREHSRSQLEVDPRLAEIAREHAGDMMRRGYFDHSNPDGDSPADRVSRGHRRLIGLTAENIWKGGRFSLDDLEALARRIGSSLMGSPGHRANILEPLHTHIGVGVVIKDGEIRVVQLLATVQAYLDKDLPRRIRSAQRLDLEMRLVAAARPAVKFDLYSRRRRTAAGPVAIFEAVPASPPGERGVRFFFPSAKPLALDIYPGPSVQVN